MRNIRIDRELSRRLALWISVVILFGIFVVLTMYSKIYLGNSILCPFAIELNIECPGCGGTRMLEALMNLDFYQALRWNPFIFLTLPILIVVYTYQSYLFIIKNEMIQWIDKFIYVYIILFIIFGVIRNIEIFEWLKPTLV